MRAAGDTARVLAVKLVRWPNLTRRRFTLCRFIDWIWRRYP